MSLRPTPPPPPEIKLASGPTTKTPRIFQTRHYRLITPLFGGGVDAGENDPLTLISGKAVRGQLRFWWRATRGGQFPDLAQLKAAEELLWGGPSTKNNPRPSQVNIEITVTNPGQLKKPFTVTPKEKYGRLELDRRGNKIPELTPHEDVAPAYFAFPLQPPTPLTIGMETKAVRVGVTFALKISYPTTEEKSQRDFKTEVEAALWGWETFGGIGGRTRRGFGALQLESYEINGSRKTPNPLNSVISDLNTQLASYVVAGNWHKDIPHLPRCIDADKLKVTSAKPKAHDVWTYLGQALRKFRQSRSNNEGQPSDYGKSDWPEPNEIRACVNDWSEEERSQPFKFKKELVTNGVQKFPRAVFGLPIVFHLPQEDQDFTEFPDATLQAEALAPNEKNTRLASPLILRPLALGKGRFVGLAVILETPQTPPQGVILQWTPPRQDNAQIWDANVQLESNEARSIKPLKGETDVLKAFLKTLY